MLEKVLKSWAENKQPNLTLGVIRQIAMLAGYAKSGFVPVNDDYADCFETWEKPMASNTYRRVKIPTLETAVWFQEEALKAFSVLVEDKDFWKTYALTSPAELSAFDKRLEEKWARLEGFPGILYHPDLDIYYLTSGIVSLSRVYRYLDAFSEAVVVRLLQGVTVEDLETAKRFRLTHPGVV